MKNKRSSLKADLTASQWLAIDTLSAMLKGPLPQFSLVGVPDGEIWKLTRANLAREKLWKVFQKRIFIEYRTVEECSYKFEPIITTPKNEGEEYFETRNVSFDIVLVTKPGVVIPQAHCLLRQQSISFGVKMETERLLDQWQVRSIILRPEYDVDRITLFNSCDLNYSILAVI